MKDVKFKAITYDNKWVYGSFVKADVDIGGYGAYPSIEPFRQIVTEDGSTYNIDERTLCQFTSLKDTYGVNIYDGDILRDKNNVEYLVVFHQGAFMLQEFLGSKLGDYEEMPITVSFGECKIIGNIHEGVSK